MNIFATPTQTNHDKERDFKTEKDVSAMLATDLSQLSLEDRTTVFERIHGVEPVVEESEAMVERALKDLSEELEKIKEKDAYNMAVEASDSSRAYVESQKFRLLFLRCEDFCVKKAATRLVHYMDRMLEYFGPEVLGRPLYYSDLHPDAKAYMKLGYHQLVHHARDSAGRAICFDNCCSAVNGNQTNQALIQTYIYLYYSAVANDKLTQIRGVVFIGYVLGSGTSKFNRETYKGVPELESWFPIKLPVIHVLFDNPESYVKLWAPIAWAVLGPEVRKKLKIHNGPYVECMYHLQGFGIPTDALPVTYLGEMKTAFHEKWIAKEKMKEKAIKENQQPLDAVIDVPTRNDVVLWRGRVYQQHPGNLHMRALIEEYQQEYSLAPKGSCAIMQRGTKAEISMRIVSIIKKGHGGRFLTQDDGGWWVEVSDREAQQRVSKSFRSARSATKKATSVSTDQVKKAGFHETGNGNKRLRMGSSFDAKYASDHDCCFSPIRITIPPRPEGVRLAK